MQTVILTSQGFRDSEDNVCYHFSTAYCVRIISELEEKGVVGWHHWLNGHEFEKTQGDSDGQRSLVCCSPWGHKESDMTERLNKKEICRRWSCYWNSEVCHSSSYHRRPVSTNPLCTDKQRNASQDPWILGSNPVCWLSHFNFSSPLLSFIILLKQIFK